MKITCRLTRCFLIVVYFLQPNSTMHYHQKPIHKNSLTLLKILGQQPLIETIYYHQQNIHIDVLPPGKIAQPKTTHNYQQTIHKDPLPS